LSNVATHLKFSIGYPFPKQ